MAIVSSISISIFLIFTAFIEVTFEFPSGELPTQILAPYVLSHATSFPSLFGTCPPSFNLLTAPLSIHAVMERFHDYRLFENVQGEN